MGLQPARVTAEQDDANAAVRKSGGGSATDVPCRTSDQHGLFRRQRATSLWAEDRSQLHRRVPYIPKFHTKEILGLGQGGVRGACGREFGDNAIVQYPQLGRQIAHGNTSDVYEVSGDSVVKLLRSDIPPEWAEREAQIADAVHGAGLPAPAVLDQVVVSGRPGIVMQHIHGDSMWAHMLEHPEDTPKLAQVLSDLQAEINATPAPAELPTLVDRLAENITAADALTDDQKDLARASLVDLPELSRVCHFDIHPKNVLMSPNGPIAVDWFDAAVGDPAADVVRSSVLMGPSSLIGHLDEATPELLATLHGEYLAYTLSVRSYPVEVLLAWEPPITASHLGEPLPEEEIAATLESWEAIRTGDTRSDLGMFLESRRSQA